MYILLLTLAPALGMYMAGKPISNLDWALFLIAAVLGEIREQLKKRGS